MSMPVGSFTMELSVQGECFPHMYQILSYSTQMSLEKPLSDEPLQSCYSHFMYQETF